MQGKRFREQLPENCPPREAWQVNEELEMFRLVRRQIPVEADFRSQRAERPKASFPGVSECRARGLSLFADREDAAMRLSLPKLRGRKICRVRLDSGAGYIEQTGEGSHHTWWPLAEYDILAQCHMEST